jgi:hypothetical protein
VPAQYLDPPIGWFDIDSLDRDNFRFHLEMTPAQEAWLAQAIAEAYLAYKHAKRAADDKEDALFIEYKDTPYERMTSKGPRQVDVSDELALRFAHQDPLLQTLRRQEDETHANYKKWMGFQRAFQTKKAVLASLAGLTRAEMELFKDAAQEDE